MDWWIGPLGYRTWTHSRRRVAGICQERDMSYCGCSNKPKMDASSSSIQWRTAGSTYGTLVGVPIMCCKTPETQMLPTFQMIKLRWKHICFPCYASLAHNSTVCTSLALPCPQRPVKHVPELWPVRRRTLCIYNWPLKCTYGDWTKRSYSSPTPYHWARPEESSGDR